MVWYRSVAGSGSAWVITEVVQVIKLQVSKLMCYARLAVGIQPATIAGASTMSFQQWPIRGAGACIAYTLYKL